MKTIRFIAQDVRRRCEIFKSSTDARCYDFYKKNNLKGMCAVASYALHDALKKANIRSRVVNGTYNAGRYWSGHCWIEYKDHIIDITATQFKIHRPVRIVRKTSRLYTKANVFNKYRDFFRWIPSQKPSPEITQKILDIAS
jgi:hypothetical protein